MALDLVFHSVLSTTETKFSFGSKLYWILSRSHLVSLQPSILCKCEFLNLELSPSDPWRSFQDLQRHCRIPPVQIFFPVGYSHAMYLIVTKINVCEYIYEYIYIYIYKKHTSFSVLTLASYQFVVCLTEIARASLLKKFKNISIWQSNSWSL